MHDVYAYGVVAPSTLIQLDDEFPPPGGYAEIAGVHPSIGGEAAGGAYVLARLGIATKLAGNRLSDDAPARHVLETLVAAGVDCSAIRLDPESAAVREIVISAADERTVFGTYRKMAADRRWDEPSPEDIRASRIVCLDPFFADESRTAARLCRRAGIPYVTVDAPPESEIARNADVLVVSEEYANRTLGHQDPLRSLALFTHTCRGLVILTRGGKHLVYGRQKAAPQEFTPTPVDVRDTTGAGDGFRAGIIYGMLRGYGEERLIRTASAVAALICSRLPGVVGSPTERELTRFLDRQS